MQGVAFFDFNKVQEVKTIFKRSPQNLNKRKTMELADSCVYVRACSVISFFGCFCGRLFDGISDGHVFFYKYRQACGRQMAWVLV